MTTDWYNELLALTASHLKYTVQQAMPEGTFREFYLWALADNSQYRNPWLELNGIHQTLQMTLQLLHGLVQTDSVEPLIPYIIPMNIYLAFEVVSDNLAIGLATQTVQDKTYAVRRELLCAFNDAMLYRLSGHPQHAEQLLAPLARDAARISLFKQSLNPQQFHVTAAGYVAAHPEHHVAEIEYGTWPLLVANIETCNKIVQIATDSPVSSLVYHSLAARYRAVTELLTHDAILPRRAHLGADAVLAMPVLAYYIGALEKTLWRHEAFPAIVQDGTLSEALLSVALLVRLLNDLGTPLITQTNSQRVRFMDALTSLYNVLYASQRPFSAMLLDAEADFPDLLFRIAKDLRSGQPMPFLRSSRDLPTFRSYTSNPRLA
jgi:hypothetical protein